VHPYDDDAIVAGQGTIGRRDAAAPCPTWTMLVVADRRWWPDQRHRHRGQGTSGRAIEVVTGVQVGALCGHGLTRSRAGTIRWAPVRSPRASPSARVGVRITEADHPRTARRRQVLLVDEGDIEQAVLMLLEIEKTVVEGAGAAGLAALLKYPAALSLPQASGWCYAGATSTRCCWRLDH
jgi:threonine dehydratase